jgi:hypothetical protein
MTHNFDTIYNFDIIYNHATASALINKYDNLDLEQHIEDEENIDRKLRAVLKRVVEQDLWKLYCKPPYDSHKYNKNYINCFDEKFFIGDIVKVSYIPESQKYIDYYQEQAFVGRIIFVDNENDNAFFVTMDEPHTITIKSLLREGCHYFGMTLGYSYHIIIFCISSK